MRRQAVKAAKLPLSHFYLPPFVDIAQLYSNVKLLPQHEINRIVCQIKEAIEEHQERQPNTYLAARYSKKHFNIPYGIVLDAHGIYVIYRKKVAEYSLDKDIPADMKKKDGPYTIFQKTIGSNTIYEVYKE